MQLTGQQLLRSKREAFLPGLRLQRRHCSEQTELVLARAQAVGKVRFLSVRDFILMGLLLRESTYLGEIFIWHFG